jgi:hypothetical protein
MRPKSQLRFWVKIRRTTDNYNDVQQFSISTGGLISENFNNDDSSWDLDGFAIFEAGDIQST